MDTSIKRWKIIGASSVGTLIEWYDFYIFGSLATLLSTKFFPSDNPVAAFMATLATFAAGFIVRPFGALFFGRLGDLIGRKHTFMVTLLLMGGATFLIGCIPSYESIGYLAPFLVLLLRLLQGLALGGEYGGAATYVAEQLSSKSTWILDILDSDHCHSWTFNVFTGYYDYKKYTFRRSV